MDQGNTGSQTVEPITMVVTHQADNHEMDEGEYSGLSLAGALGQPYDDSPSTRRMSAKHKKVAKEALVHANSKRKVVVNKTSRLVKPRQKKLDFTPGNKMSYKQIDAGEKKDVQETQLTSVRQELKKAKIQVVNTELHSQERLQTEKLAKAIAIQDEAEQAKMMTVTSIFEKELKCGICRQTFINPTVTNCGHTFCRFCINGSRLLRSQCPTCNHRIRNVTSNYELSKLLDKIALQLPAESEKARQTQLTHREEEEEASPEARAQEPGETGRDEAEQYVMMPAAFLQSVRQFVERLDVVLHSDNE